MRRVFGLSMLLLALMLPGCQSREQRTNFENFG